MKRNFIIVMLITMIVGVLAPQSYAQETSNDGTQHIHPFDVPQTDNYPEEIQVVIEIPQGSLIKYEIDADTGYVVADRFQSMSVQYPGNYGSIPQTIGGDGDPLDVLVLTREPLVPGTVMTVRPIGTLNMIDGGEADEKIIAVPASSIDPMYDKINDLSDLPKIELQRIEKFFAVYKQLPEGRKSVELNGFETAEVTKQAVKKAIDAYQAENNVQRFIPYVNPYHYPQGDKYPEEMMALIEIPSGSFTKYEVDADTGHLIADRFQSMPVKYPANYGSLPQTIGGDGDPLDVLVLTREPLAPMSFIKVRPIGTLQMVDGGEADEKIIAVPVSKVDPTYDDIEDISDLPQIEKDRIEKFFAVYKQLPEGRKSVELNGYSDAQSTKSELKIAVDSYRNQKHAAMFPWTHPFDFPQKNDSGKTFNAVIEIPSGSFTKYEIDEETGKLFADRFQSMAVNYPGNYGSIPQSKGGDNDPLDVIVLTRQPLVPGTVVEVRAIGLLKMIDDGELDDKVIAVPTSDIDPTYDNIQDISDLPVIQAEQIEMFFKVYKLLPSKRKYVEINGYDNQSAAQAEVHKSLLRYKDQPVTSENVIGGVERIQFNNRSMVPLRQVAQLIGAKVEWKGSARSASIQYGDKSYTLQIDQSIAVNSANKEVQLDESPQFVKGSVYVPLSFMIEQLGVKTTWNEAKGVIEVYR